MTTSDSDVARLRAAFDSYATRVLVYASRHVDAHAAHDVVSEVFLTAWRRIDDLPDKPLPWLLVVARNTIHNRTRSISRQRRVADRIAALDATVATSPGADDTALDRQAMVAALAALSDPEREALLLTAWDGLSAAESAVITGCSRHAFEVRLHRARSRLARALDDDQPPLRPASRPIASSQEICS